MLPTAIVNFKCGEKQGQCRVMLDSCSQPTLISDSFVNRFKLPINRGCSSCPVKGIGGNIIKTDSSVDLTLLSRFESFELELQPNIVPASSLSYSVNYEIPARIHNQLHHFPLADNGVHFASPTICKLETENSSVVSASLVHAFISLVPPPLFLY